MNASLFLFKMTFRLFCHPLFQPVNFSLIRITLGSLSFNSFPDFADIKHCLVCFVKVDNFFSSRILDTRGIYKILWWLFDRVFQRLVFLFDMVLSELAWCHCVDLLELFGKKLRVVVTEHVGNVFYTHGGFDQQP